MARPPTVTMIRRNEENMARTLRVMPGLVPGIHAAP